MTSLPAIAHPQDEALVTAQVLLAQDSLVVFRMSDREPLYAISSVDAVLEKLSGEGDMAMGGMAYEPRKLKTGEHKLAAKVVLSALDDAELPRDCQLRRDARSWLRDSAALFSARVCFEALGVDYDVAVEKLEQRWHRVP